ncbi:hypothetical protein ACFFUB_14175 [Algimonas porphyrae]|nr:hypothetical protein [Algimonas porphyrae]
MMKANTAITLCLLGCLLSACAHTVQPLTPSATLTAPDDTTPDYATAPLDRSTPQATAYSLMIAMYRGDPAMADAIFAPDARLIRLRRDGRVDPNGLSSWREWVGTLDVGQAEEELFDLEVKQSGKLASVWAPFVIRVDGVVRGCGVNHLTMADMGEDGASEWRIVSGIDVQAEGCEEFRDRY